MHQQTSPFTIQIHLPSLRMDYNTLVARLRTKMAQLPGVEAQHKMIPEQRQKYSQAKPDSKQAGVVALIHPNEQDEYQLVYIKRTSKYPGDKHKGQISFPGGQLDETDDDLQDAALRELEEELGIRRHDIELLGPLTSIYVYVSDFFVQPYLAIMDHAPVFVPEPEEVAYPISFPLKTLISGENKGIKDIHVRNIVLPKVPYYDLYGDTLWGATAMMTSEITTLLSDIFND